MNTLEPAIRAWHRRWQRNPLDLAALGTAAITSVATGVGFGSGFKIVDQAYNRLTRGEAASPDGGEASNPAYTSVYRPKFGPEGEVEIGGIRYLVESLVSQDYGPGAAKKRLVLRRPKGRVRYFSVMYDDGHVSEPISMSHLLNPLSSRILRGHLNPDNPRGKPRRPSKWVIDKARAGSKFLYRPRYNWDLPGGWKLFKVPSYLSFTGEEDYEITDPNGYEWKVNIGRHDPRPIVYLAESDEQANPIRYTERKLAGHEQVPEGAEYRMVRRGRYLVRVAFWGPKRAGRAQYSRATAVLSPIGTSNPDGKSRGHVAFIGPWEYFRAPSGDLYRAPRDNEINAFGYREGARFESTPGRTSDMALKLAREAFRGWQQNPTGKGGRNVTAARGFADGLKRGLDRAYAHRMIDYLLNWGTPRQTKGPLPDDWGVSSTQATRITKTIRRFMGVDY